MYVVGSLQFVLFSSWNHPIKLKRVIAAIVVPDSLGIVAFYTIIRFAGHYS